MTFQYFIDAVKKKKKKNYVHMLWLYVLVLNSEGFNLLQNKMQRTKLKIQ